MPLRQLSGNPAMALIRRLVSRTRSRSITWLVDNISADFGRYIRPTAVVCLLTERCSSKCVHCDIWRNRGVERGPGFDEWRRLMDEIRHWLGPVDVVLTGGEALLKPFTVDLASYASGIGLRVEVLTHGYWKDQNLIERLALSRPRRVTLSLDGIGELHDAVRGRPGFFDRTSASIETLLRIRREHGLDYEVLLKTVVMSVNLHGLDEVTRYATERGIDVLFQPIEQNYGEPDNPEWTSASANWPTDTNAAVAAIERLVESKRGGARIVNSERDLDRIAAYFRDPDRYRVRIQNHDFSGRCSALGLLQVQANGDAMVCFSAPPIGNFLEAPIHRIWAERPALWREGCCMKRRMSPTEWRDTHP